MPLDEPDLTDLPGHERIKAWLTSELPPKHTFATFGLEFSGISSGEMTVRLPLGPHLLDETGRTPPGLLGLMADMCTGGATASVQGSGHMVATSSMTVEQLVTELPIVGHLDATATLTSRRGNHLLARGKVTSDGAVMAEVGAWFMILPPREPSSGQGGYEAQSHAVPEPVTVDPHASPIAKLIGLSAPEQRGGRVRLTLPADPGLFNLMGTLHGGVGALLADLVSHAAVGPGAAYRPLTTSYSYLRTAGTLGKPVVAEAEIVRRGRNVAMVESRVLTADGRPSVHAVITADVS